MDNVNPETGVRYGVIPSSRVRALEEAIFERGENLTYKAWKDGQSLKLEQAIRDKDRKAFQAAFEETFECRDQDPDLIDELLLTPPALEAPGAPSSVVAALFREFPAAFDADEPDYRYEDDEGNVFRMSYLGGGPLIWCIRTDRVVKARLCSLCVPNAGDLTALDGPYECYGVPEKWLG